MSGVVSSYDGLCRSVLEPIEKELMELVSQAPEVTYFNKGSMAEKLMAIFGKFQAMISVFNAQVPLEGRIEFMPRLHEVQEGYKVVANKINEKSPVSSALFGSYSCCLPESIAIIEEGWSLVRQEIDGPCEMTVPDPLFAALAKEAQAKKAEMDAKRK